MIYKNKFVVLYNQNDECVCVAETWNELADFLESNIPSVQSRLSRMIGENKTVKSFLYNGNRLTPYLFSAEDDDDAF